MLTPDSPRPVRRRGGAVLLALVVATALPVAAAAPAAAHDRLESTDPADGAALDTAPDAVVLTMSSTPLGLGTQVQVTGPDGVVSQGDPQVVDTTVSQPLAAARPAGSYEVRWRVTSSDGHPVSGSFTFTATTTTTTTTTTTATGAATPTPTLSATSPGTAGQEPAQAPAPSATPAAVDPVSSAASGPGGTAITVGTAVVLLLAGVGVAVGLRRRRG